MISTPLTLSLLLWSFPCSPFRAGDLISILKDSDPKYPFKFGFSAKNFKNNLIGCICFKRSMILATNEKYEPEK